MDPFYKQDVFFFITSIAVIVIAILFAILIVYWIRISKDVKDISNKARNETDLITEDIDELRRNIKTQGAKIRFFKKFFSRFYRKK